MFSVTRQGFTTGTDALSRQVLLLIEVAGFEEFQHQYSTDLEFQEIWVNCLNHERVSDFHIQKEYLFKGNLLCIPTGSFHLYLIQEFHGSGLSAHTKRDKTIALLTERFF